MNQGGGKLCTVKNYKKIKGIAQLCSCFRLGALLYDWGARFIYSYF